MISKGDDVRRSEVRTEDAAFVLKLSLPQSHFRRLSFALPSFCHELAINEKGVNRFWLHSFEGERSRGFQDNHRSVAIWQKREAHIDVLGRRIYVQDGFFAAVIAREPKRRSTSSPAPILCLRQSSFNPLFESKRISLLASISADDQGRSYGQTVSR